MPTETGYAITTKESVGKGGFHYGPFRSIEECISATMIGLPGEVIVEIGPDSSKIVREWDGDSWAEPKGIL